MAYPRRRPFPPSQMDPRHAPRRLHHRHVRPRPRHAGQALHQRAGHSRYARHGRRPGQRLALLRRPRARPGAASPSRPPSPTTAPSSSSSRACSTSSPPSTRTICAPGGSPDASLPLHRRLALRALRLHRLRHHHARHSAAACSATAPIASCSSSARPSSSVGSCSSSPARPRISPVRNRKKNKKCRRPFRNGGTGFGGSCRKIVEAPELLPFQTRPSRNSKPAELLESRNTAHARVKLRRAGRQISAPRLTIGLGQTGFAKRRTVKRRHFLAASIAASTLAAAGETAAQAPTSPRREFYQLRRYNLLSGPQLKLTENYFSERFDSRVGSHGLGPVGAFKLDIGPETPAYYLLIPGPSIEPLAELDLRLARRCGVPRGSRSILERHRRSARISARGYFASCSLSRLAKAHSARRCCHQSQTHLSASHL